MSSPNIQRRQDTRDTMASETLDGYVIDVGCIRKNARDELLEKARTHSRECALMGHCVESGYGIVTEDDRLTVLDSEATPKIVNTVEGSDTEEGIRLRVQREEQDGSMETTSIEEIS
ncbi:hypothetical protein [Haloarcula amylovorans]|nr:hypothetical protein [Halomicroarcula amylolytica]